MSKLHSQGFTLVELLVGISLLSVIMLASGSMLRSVAQTETRIDARSAAQDEGRVQTAFLRQVLGHVSATPAKPPQPGLKPDVQFFGGADHIDWVGVMPARPGAGGRYFFRLAFVSGPDQLLTPVLRFAVWSPNTTLDQVAYTDERALFRSVRGYQIQYADISKSAEPVWFPVWNKPDRLPAAVRIELDTGPLPGLVPIVIALRPLSASEPPRSVFSSGPRSR